MYGSQFLGLVDPQEKESQTRVLDISHPKLLECVTPVRQQGRQPCPPRDLILPLLDSC